MRIDPGHGGGRMDLASPGRTAGASAASEIEDVADRVRVQFQGANDLSGRDEM